MLAAATAAAEAEAASAAAASIAGSSSSTTVAASPPRTAVRKGGSDSPSVGELTSKRGSPIPSESYGKPKGKTPPSLKRKSMMAGDRHRRDVEEEADESRPDSPASDVSSSSSSNAKNSAQQVPLCFFGHSVSIPIYYMYLSLPLRCISVEGNQFL